MCCFFTTLVLFGPRLAILIWWLVQPMRWQLAFGKFGMPFLWELLGFLFLPWTTIMYVLVAPAGVTGFDWIWLGLGLLADIASYSGGAYSGRGRMSGQSY
jgi:hypothetical protein